MRKIRKYIVLISIIFSIVFFFYSLYVDIANSSTYSILPIESQLHIIESNGYFYYTYENHAILKDFQSQGFEEDIIFLKDLTLKYKYVLVVEFSDFDKYFTEIKDQLDKDILNSMRYAHYIKAAEIDKFDDQMIVQRFHRALKERKIRYFILPEHPRTLNLINLIQKDLGTPVNINSINYSEPTFIFSGIGVGLIFLNLFSYVPLFAIIYILCFIFLNNWSFTIAATLFSIIIFFKVSKNNLLKIISYSLLFGILVFMSGYNNLLIFKLNNVRGVKILLVVLPALVLLKAFIDFTGITFKKDDIKNAFKKIKSVRFRKTDIALLLLVIAAGIIYIVRSSNWAFVTNFERQVRDYIERVLIARPRTKEIISYFFYYTPSLPGRSFIWNTFRAILPVSILDTFLHIHTPLYLSVLRTINGFLVSLILLLIILFVETIIKKIRESKSSNQLESDLQRVEEPQEQQENSQTKGV